MELGYGVQLELKQQLSQNQIQSLEILAMDGLELNRFLQNEYLENPLLDYSGNHGPNAGNEESARQYERALTYDKNYEELVEEEDRKRREIPMQDPDRVKNYLLDQLPRGNFDKDEWQLMEFMVECLDDTGFFTIPLEEVAHKMRTSKENVRRSLRILQELEPWGIFAPDLRSCLLKQLERKGLGDSLVYKVVEEYLQDVADGRISNISRGLKVSTAQVRGCIEEIARLNPRPMNEFGSGNFHYIVPDIIFREENGKWETELNDSWIEDYHINDYYLRMMKESKDEELREYFRAKLERVRFVMNSIIQRQRTITAISESVMRRQRAYLEGGAYLLPMTMTDVAEELGIHTSTVSRAIRGKYIQYPGGTVMMKTLFSASVTKTDGNVAVGTMQIKELIRGLVEEEDKAKPYSDQAIVNILKEKNIDISRRAVAKYREELGIRGSFDRKEITGN